MSKQRFLGGLLGANPVRDGSFTDPTTTTVTNVFGTDDGAEEVTYYADNLAGANDTSVLWGPDGTRFYWVAGSTYYQVDCSTAYDLTTAGTPQNVTASGGLSPSGRLSFNDDGTQVQYANNATTQLRWRPLTSAYDITTLGSENTHAGYGYYLHSHLGNDGNLYLVSRETIVTDDGDVRTFNDPSAFNSGVTNKKQLDSGVQYNQSGGVFASTFNDDGTVMWIALTGDYAGIEELHLSTPYDPTSVTKANNITVPIDTDWTASSGASEIKSLQYANGVLWVMANNSGRKLYKFPFSETVSSTADRTTSNVGILSLDEAGPEANSEVPTITSTDIGPNYILSSEGIPTDATNWIPTSDTFRGNWVDVSGMRMAEVYATPSATYKRVYQTVTGLSLTDGSTATLSAYVKEGTSSDNHALRVDTAGNSGGVNFVFKFVNGVPTKDAAQTSGFSNYALGTETIEDMGDGRWRISVPFTNNSGSTQSTHVVHCYTTWETANTNSVYWGGVQLVEGSVAGDYAKTTTTTVNTTASTAGVETRLLTPLNWGGIRGRSAVIDTTNPSLDLNFDGQASSYTRATTDPTAAKANGDQLATSIVTQNKGGTVQSKYMGPDGKLINGYVENKSPNRDPDALTLAGTATRTTTTGQLAPDGSSTAVLFTSTGNGSIYGVDTNVSFTSGEHYTLSVYMKVVTGTVIVGPLLTNAAFGGYERAQYTISAGGGTPTLAGGGYRTGSGDYGIQDVGDGWYRLWVSGTATTTTNHAGNQVFRVDLAGVGEEVLVWGPQFEEGVLVPSQYIDATADQVARVEYDASGNPLGLLVEEQRTNFLPESHPYGGGWYTSGSYTATDNYSTAPDGTTTSVRYQYSTSASSFEQAYRNTSQAPTAGTTYTASVWYRGTGGFKLNLGQQGLSGANTNVAFTASDTWQRADVQRTAINSGGVGTLIIGLWFTNATGDADIEFWGAQIEEGEGPTSLIPTTSGSVTRTADDITLATSDFGVDKVYGTAAIDVTLNSAASNSTFPTLFRVMGGTARNLMAYHYDALSIIDVQWNEGTAYNQRVLDGLAYPLNVKLAQRRDGTVGSHAFNGTVSAATTIDVGTTSLDTLHLGGVSGSNVSNCHIRRFIYWPRAISDGQLAEYSYDPNFGGRMEYRGILSLNEVAQSRR